MVNDKGATKRMFMPPQNCEMEMAVFIHRFRFNCGFIGIPCMKHMDVIINFKKKNNGLMFEGYIYIYIKVIYIYMCINEIGFIIVNVVTEISNRLVKGLRYLKLARLNSTSSNVSKLHYNFLTVNKLFGE